MDDEVDRGHRLDDVVEGAGGGDIGDDAEVEILRVGGGMLGAYLVGLALGADNGANGEVGGEELGEDVRS